MLQGLTLGAALYYWAEMVHGPEGQEGPFPTAWWHTTVEEDPEGEPHQEGCGCSDCQGEEVQFEEVEDE